MSRLRPMDVRKRRPTWLDDDLPPAPLGSRRARLEAQRQYLDQYDELRAEDEDCSSPSYHRPDY
jgi:hypothetical protein